MAIKRVRYYDQQSLVEPDFTDEQRYHINQRRRINRLFHAFGIADGLQVIRSGNKQVTVTAGFAIDRDGREIVLDADRVLDLSNAGQFPPNGTVFVTASYQETLSDPSTKGAPGNTRVTENAAIAAVTTPPPADGSVIRLCRFVTTDTGDVPGNPNDEIDNAVRVAATSKLGAAAIAESNLAAPLVAKINTAIASVEGIANPGGNIDLVNSGAITINTDAATARIAIGETHSARVDNPHNTTAVQAQAVSTNGATMTGSLVVNGSVGGNTAPVARLHIASSGPAVRITDGAQGVGRTLASDANGSAAWKDTSASFFANPSPLNPLAITATTTPGKLGDFVTFTKAIAESAVEVTLTTRAIAGAFASGASGVNFQIRIDNNPATFATEGFIADAGTAQLIVMFAVFQGLAAGSHTVSVFCRTFTGQATNVVLDPGNAGGRLVVKETF
jgi:hypothetical protein